MKFLFRLRKGLKRFVSVVFSFFVLVLMLAGSSVKARGYDNDTHFWLTYYLAVKAGYDPVQATQIASANVSVDFDTNTEPLTPKTLASVNPFEGFRIVRYELHALPPSDKIFKQKIWSPSKIADAALLEIARKFVQNRKLAFWQATIKERSNPGIFLHYLQDTYSHDGFSSYIGHAGYYYVDFLSADKEKAKLMALETYRYLKIFQQVLAAPKDFAELPKPEKIVIDAATQAEIIKAVEEFSRINPTDGIVPNIIDDDWNNLDEDAQSKFSDSQKSWLCALYLIKRNAPSPNSRLTREAVGKLLKVKETDLPHIWIYDLKSSGAPERKFTDTALIYGDVKEVKRKVFTYGDEAANYKRTKPVIKNAKKQCLRFNIVENAQINPSECR